MLIVLLVSSAANAALEHGLGGASANEGAAFNGSDVMVLERSLCIVLEGAIFNGQSGIIIVLDGIETAIKGTALDGQCRVHHAIPITIVIIAVLKQAGVLALVVDHNISLDSHVAMVQNGVEAVAASIVCILAGFGRALVGAVGKGDSALVVNSGLAVRHIVHGAGAGNSQRCPQCDCNGVLLVSVGQLLTVQVERDGLVRGDGDIFGHILQQHDGVAVLRSGDGGGEGIISAYCVPLCVEDFGSQVRLDLHAIGAVVVLRRFKAGSAAIDRDCAGERAAGDGDGAIGRSADRAVELTVFNFRLDIGGASALHIGLINRRCAGKRTAVDGHINGFICGVLGNRKRRILYGVAIAICSCCDVAIATSDVAVCQRQPACADFDTGGGCSDCGVLEGTRAIAREIHTNPVILTGFAVRSGDYRILDGQRGVFRADSAVDVNWAIQAAFIGAAVDLDMTVCSSRYHQRTDEFGAFLRSVDRDFVSVLGTEHHAVG